MSGAHEPFVMVLGRAVAAEWSGLPRDVQESLFEQAVRLGAARQPDLREQLARFLHHEHERTAPST